MHRSWLPTVLACGLTLSACGAQTAGFAAMPRRRARGGSSPSSTFPTVSPAATRAYAYSRRAQGRAPRAVTSSSRTSISGFGRNSRRYLNAWDARQPTTVVLDGKHVSSTWARALLDRKAGSRVLLVTPARQGFGPLGMAPAGVSPSDTLVEVFESLAATGRTPRSAARPTIRSTVGCPR
jgi:peptidylprolyl isomerase